MDLAWILCLAGIGRSEGWIIALFVRWIWGGEMSDEKLEGGGSGECGLGRKDGGFWRYETLLLAVHGS